MLGSAVLSSLALLAGMAEGVTVELTTSVEKGLYALFVCACEVYLCRSGTLAWISKKLGSNGRMRLRRGYEPSPSKAGWSGWGLDDVVAGQREGWEEATRHRALPAIACRFPNRTHPVMHP